MILGKILNGSASSNRKDLVPYSPINECDLYRCSFVSEEEIRKIQSMKKEGHHLKINGFVSTSSDYKFAVSKILEEITIKTSEEE